MKKSKILFSFVLFIILISLLIVVYNNTKAEKLFFIDTTLQDSSYYLSLDNFDSSMINIVEPRLDSLLISGYFYNKNDSAKIYYEQYLLENPKANILISHGFGESLIKYLELVYYFVNEGYSVHILDHRGHGKSQRNVENLSKVHIETDFYTYVDDIKQFTLEYLLPQSKENIPNFLFAHSMGGCVGAFLLKECPNVFSAAVLSTPMFEINFGDYPSFIAKPLANFLYTFSDKEAYAPTHGDFDSLDIESYKDTPKYRYYNSKKNKDRLYQTNGATISWLKHSIDAAKEITSKKVASQITTPILIFQADNDSYVKKEGLYKFAKYAPNVQLIFVPNSYHELYMEPKENFVPYMNTIFNFYSKYY